MTELRLSSGPPRRRKKAKRDPGEESTKSEERIGQELLINFQNSPLLEKGSAALLGEKEAGERKESKRRESGWSISSA